MNIERHKKMKLKNKVAVITGGTSGIGKATVLRFCEEGAKVVIVGRNKERGDALVETVKKKGGEAYFVQADMSNPADLDNLLQKTIDKYGQIDILFNNAGIYTPGPFESYTSEKWDELMDINLKGPFLMAQKTMPYLLKTKGNIVNTASIAGLRASASAYVYGESKSGLIMLTKILAREFAQKGVRVNAVCPGVIDTPILGGLTKEVIEKTVGTIPLNRMGQPEDIANVVLFLASDEASYVTGHALVVDGGLTV